MAKLPFLVEPRLKPRVEVLGNELSGQIEIERRGYLNVGEKMFLQQAQQSDETTEQVLALIRQIGKEQGLGLERAHKIVIAMLDGSDSEDEMFETCSKKYRKRCESIMTLALNQQHQAETVKALCMLIYRVDPEIDMDTLSKLHPDLIADLAQLCTEEEMRSIERLSDGIEADGEPISDDGYEALEKK